MTGFAFDAKAALERAQNRPTVPNRPNLPNYKADDGQGLGGFGRVRASNPEMTPEDLALDLFEERAAIREFEGGQDRAEAEREAWAEACRAAGL